MSKRRVVVTGLGTVSPVGLDVKTSWENILAGKSGIGPIEHFDVSDYTVRFGGTVKGFAPDDIISTKDAKKMDMFIQYGLVAATEAMSDSGLEVTDENAERIGVAIGSGIGGIGVIEKNHQKGTGRRQSGA